MEALDRTSIPTRARRGSVAVGAADTAAQYVATLIICLLQEEIAQGDDVDDEQGRYSSAGSLDCLLGA